MNGYDTLINIGVKCKIDSLKTPQRKPWTCTMTNEVPVGVLDLGTKVIVVFLLWYLVS